MRELNAPIYIKWILSQVKERYLENKSMGKLYKNFCEWNISINEEPITLTAFGLLLKNKKITIFDKELTDFDKNSYLIEKIGEKKNSKGLVKFVWNICDVVEGLKDSKLLEDDFVY